MEESKKLKLNPNLQKLIDSGIPVWRAEFQGAVNNTDDVPENYFSSKSAVKSRNVQMWLTPHFLICYHKGEYFAVPNANVKFDKLDAYA